jgi:hypothetical protein
MGRNHVPLQILNSHNNNNGDDNIAQEIQDVSSSYEYGWTMRRREEGEEGKKEAQT